MEAVIAYRRLVYRFSQRLTWEERRGLIYMRLYNDRQKYKSSDTFDVLMRLEADGVFSPSNPAGLQALAKDVKRKDLEKKVRKYIRNVRTGETTAQHDEATESSTEMDSDALRDQMVKLLRLVTVLTEQCSQEFGVVCGYGEILTKRERARRRLDNAKKTASDLSRIVKRVEEEIEKCQSEIGPPPHSIGGKTNASSRPASESVHRAGLSEATIFAVLTDKSPPPPPPHKKLSSCKSATLPRTQVLLDTKPTPQRTTGPKAVTINRHLKQTPLKSLKPPVAPKPSHYLPEPVATKRQVRDRWSEQCSHRTAVHTRPRPKSKRATFATSRSPQSRSPDTSTLPGDSDEVYENDVTRSPQSRSPNTSTLPGNPDEVYENDDTPVKSVWPLVSKPPKSRGPGNPTSPAAGDPEIEYEEVDQPPPVPVRSVSDHRPPPPPTRRRCVASLPRQSMFIRLAPDPRTQQRPAASLPRPTASISRAASTRSLLSRETQVRWSHHMDSDDSTDHDDSGFVDADKCRKDHKEHVQVKAAAGQRYTPLIRSTLDEGEEYCNRHIVWLK